ncbi:MAG TPA: AI-2E family transporter [Burkholderiales bacterium]|nr:AI-2E family transporter [Burkholderiales bacterium]
MAPVELMDRAPPEAEAGTRYSRTGLSAAVLALIAFIAALYLARAFFIPLLIGILASYALRPTVDWLCKCRVPRAVAAALVLAAVVAGFSWIAFSLSDDAAAMVEKLPEAARKLRQSLSEARADGPTALQNVQKAASELQGAASDAAGAGKPVLRTSAARDDAPSAWLQDYMLAQSGLVMTVAAQAPIVLLLAFFLLAAGEHFRRKLVQLVGPSLAAKKDAVRMLEEIDTQIQHYLFSTVVSNALVGIGTWLAFEALSVHQAPVWGVAAGVLHFVPYLGPVAIALASGLVAYVQFGSLLSALAVAGASLVVAGAVSFLFTTWLQSRFARVNAAVLFIALLFFGWLWGIWGLLLGAPLVAIAKVVCDRVESLHPAGALLGH